MAPILKWHIISANTTIGPQSAAYQMLEIGEAIVLALVAVATAWSGYQAALWTGQQAELYGEASKLRVQADGAATYANQKRLYNAATVVEWLKAEAHGDRKLATLFERRFLPEFRPAFDAWKKTDPLDNPNAPAGPQSMPEYRSSKTEEASKLNERTTEVFEQGTRAPALRRICAGDRDTGNGAPVDRDQPAFQNKQGADWTSSGRGAPAVFSDFPYSHSSAGIDNIVIVHPDV